MRVIKAFFQLIRWQNLVVLVLAQGFLHFMIIEKLSVAAAIVLPFSTLHLFVLMLSTTMIAASGYIYNDLVDVKVDLVNKAQKVIVGKILSTKTAMVWVYALNSIGFLLSFYLVVNIGYKQLALIQILVILLLRLYSKSLKRQVLLGNLLIAALTALSVFLVYLYHVFSLLQNPIELSAMTKQLPFILKLTQAYVFFAFLSNFIREIVKDLEDKQGDQLFGIQTFPVKYGDAKTLILVRVLNGLLIISLFVFFILSLKLQWYYLGVYLFVATLIPSVYFEWNAKKAKEKNDFHALSSLMKIIMIAGILSMQVLSIQF
jgi:4-hydroxybenzoate polyprenyltransferase